jgi:hypothetical protein
LDNINLLSPDVQLEKIDSVGYLCQVCTLAVIDGSYMKKSQQHSIIAACLLPALLVLSTDVFAEDAANRHVEQENAGVSDTGYWSIPTINKRWNTPPKRDAWTIPAFSRRWNNPMPSSYWTIPRSASDLLTHDK